MALEKAKYKKFLQKEEENMKKHYELPMIEVIGLGVEDVLGVSFTDGQDNITTRPNGWDLGGYEL